MKRNYQETNENDQIGSINIPSEGENKETKELKKGPISFLTGALTSILLALICFKLSGGLVVYFTLHQPHYNSPIAESAASGFKTLVIGTSFLATFSFAFIGLGLLIVFIRSLFDAKSQESD